MKKIIYHPHPSNFPNAEWSLVSQAQGTQKIFWSESQQFDWGMFKEKRAGYGFVKAMTHSGISYESRCKRTGLLCLM